MRGAVLARTWRPDSAVTVPVLALVVRLLRASLGLPVIPHWATAVRALLPASACLRSLPTTVTTGTLGWGRGALLQVDQDGSRRRVQGGRVVLHLKLLVVVLGELERRQVLLPAIGQCLL